MKSRRPRAVRFVTLFAVFGASAWVVSCIDVGQDAETGCLADKTLPGCSASGGSKGTTSTTGQGGSKVTRSTTSQGGGKSSDSGGSAGGTQ